MPFKLESQTEPIPGYRLIERLGAGGFGEVWKCEAPGKIQKAIKFVHGDLNDVTAVDESIKAEQELRSIERIKNIRHPFILSIERYEIVDGQLMIVTELADCNLYDRFREYRGKGLMGIPRDELLGYMDEIAEALDIMTAEHDLLHLDIKPQNLFLMYNHIKIGDFGLVKDLEGMQAQVTGGVTPVYAAPETFEGYVSRYSDQYSLAIVFQELLTGVRPFSGSSPKQLMLQHVSVPPTVDALPPADRSVIEKALSKKPADRWESCRAMVHALRNSLRQKLDSPTVLPDLGKPNTQVRDRNSRGDSMPPQVAEARQGRRVDDYFELGPITLSTKALNNGNITQLRKPTSRPPMQLEADDATGVLRPVILIGMGQFGRATLQWVRQGLQLQYGPTSLPIVRCLSIDTDPAGPSEHLARVTEQEELLLTRLNRPARYIRSRDTLPPVEDWLNTNILYRMPRTQLTAGIRSLGRLALLEHYRTFRTRLERDLKAITDPVAMSEAEKISKENVLSTKPRVYLIGHLGGGTASGMLIDCAYMVRKALRAMQLDDSDIHAVCYIPDEECMNAADLPEANAVAALHEIYHYQQAGMPYRALYESKAEWIEEATPPFVQIQLIETPPRPTATHESKDHAILQVQKVAEVLNRFIATPLGRVADPTKLTAGTSPYQALGLRVLNSPRRLLIRRAAHLVFQRIMDKWLQPATSAIQDTVRLRIDGFFHYEKFSPEGLQNYFEKTTKHTIGSAPEVMIQSIIAPFQHGIHEKIPDPDAVKRALRDIIMQLGAAKVGSSANNLVLADTNTKLNRALLDACDKIVRTGASRLVFTIFRHLDKTGLRMGATEEALRYTITKLDSWIAVHEAQCKQATQEFATSMEYLRQDLAEYDRLKAVPKKRWPSMTTPGERLLTIFRARYRSLIHEHIAKVYVGFRGTCSDQQREVRFCRNRLQELQQSPLAGEKLPERPITASRVTESVMLPHGCKDLLQAVEEFAATITEDDLEKMDTVVADRLQKHYPRLAELCFSSFEQLRPVKETITQEAKLFLEQRLHIDDAAGLFLESHKSPMESFHKVYSEAEPMLHLQTEADCREAAFLMMVDSPQAKELGSLATSLYPHTQLTSSNRRDEVVLYRTIVGIQLDNLPVLSDAGMQAYRTAMDIEHFTPHSRQDITQWQSPIPALP